MIAHFSHRVTRLFSSFVFRAVMVGATGTWMSMLAVNAPAQSTRPYQMSILASTDNVSNASVDIPIFTRNVFSNYQDQPPGRSIAWLPPDANLDRHNIDWTRIVAVYVDEPYGEILKNSKHCDPSAIGATMATLEAMAAALRTKAPSARFWVNYTKREIDLMQTPAANCPLNQPYIDVISMDIYGVDFYASFTDPKLSKRYKYLYEHRATPYQQLALVPGTFTLGWEKQSGAEGAARLSGYFRYAARMNRRCDLPLGPTGITGIYDGCPVWMVAGWSGGVTPVHFDPRDYLPIDNPASKLVFDAWQAAFAVPRVDPAEMRRARQHKPPLQDD